MGAGKMKKQIVALLAVAMLSVATTALAITVNVNNINYSTVNKNLDYDFIQKSNSSSDGVKLNIVDYILSGKLGTTNNANTYTLLNELSVGNPVDTWFSNGAVSVIIDEIAGYAPTNTFGYYTMDGATQQLFAGSDSKTTPQKSFSLTSPAEFGFYLGVKNTGNFYTEASRNTLDGGKIHAAIFQVNNSNTYILGFEDLLLRNSDKDYQDMIVSVTINSAPVPEPGTMALLGIGMLGMAVYGKRRMNKEA